MYLGSVFLAKSIIIPKGYFVKSFRLKSEVNLNKKDTSSLANLAKSEKCFSYDVDIAKA